VSDRAGDWDAIVESVIDRTATENGFDDVAALIAELLPRFFSASRYDDYFHLWQEAGVHVMPVHYESPIPDTRLVSEEVWERVSEMVGIDMNDDAQLDLLRNHFPRFRSEYDAFSNEPPPGHPTHEFYFDNTWFSGTDALALYAMVRHFRPALLVEVGSGFSTRISARAASLNRDTRLVCIEPYQCDSSRHEILKKGFPGLTVIDRRIEEVELSFFDQLKNRDILFIDGSHVSRIGGDVNYLVLEIVPRLSPGVIVHIHDIYLPREYPRRFFEERRFFTEQYLVQALLAFNSDFDIILCNSYLGAKYWSDLRETFPNSPWWGGGSLWIRRKGAAD